MSEPNGTTTANIKDTRHYFFSDSRELSYSVSINRTHLAFTNESEKWIFENHQPTSPLYLLLVMAGTILLLYLLFRGSSYNIHMLHPLARTMLASKVIGMTIVMLFTALFTLGMLYAVVMGVILTAVVLLVGVFATIASASKIKYLRILSFETQWLLVLIGLQVMELFLFGSPD